MNIQVIRRGATLIPLLLPLAGCYVQPGGPGYYAQPAYSQPGYAPSPYAAYPGYSYNDGNPVYVDGGISFPLVFFDGGWGYYDHDRHWHRAPGPVSHDLDARRAGGQFHPADMQRGGQFHPNDMQPNGGMHPYDMQHGGRYEQPHPMPPGGQPGYHPGQPHPTHNEPHSGSGGQADHHGDHDHDHQ